MKHMPKQRRRGFTLTEILVAMAIFALGGSAIVALFITNARLSRQAMDYTRASEISRNIRSLMTQSLSRPIVTNNEPVYKFDYPGSSLTFRPSQYIKDREQSKYRGEDTVIGGTPVENTVFFKLPKQQFDVRVKGEESQRQMITSLPNDATDSGGFVRSFPNGRPEAFRLLPDRLRQSGALDGLDPDDRMFYAFDISIRRSVARSEVDDPARPGAKAPLEDLFVVHVKVYKGFDFKEDNQGTEVVNDPLYEWDFYITAAR
ncbi:MAG: type II secretion system protein [Planctomycetes bacterium]|nr:type II secretion system protein [Planctomycetota bacterium]